MDDPMPFSTLISIILLIIAAIILQIRLEILKYNYNEGYVAEFKEWWNESNRNENNESIENNEFGLNYHRLLFTASIVCICVALYRGFIYFESYPIFGFRGFVPVVYLEHISAVNIFWIFSILQNPLARKKLIQWFQF